MLIQYKKDFEKTAMGLLSYLPDFKNLENLKEEIKLNQTGKDFKLYLYQNSDKNIVGVVGCQETKDFIIVRYLSLAPGFREIKYQKMIMNELADEKPTKKVATLPENSYLMKLLNKNE